MPSVNYVLVYCTCGEVRKIAPERVYELRKQGELEWTQPRTLECPNCKGPMKRAPEYLEPSTTWPGQGFWPMASNVAWMS